MFVYPDIPRKPTSNSEWFAAWKSEIDLSVERSRPLIVGVFLDQTAEEINKVSDEGTVIPLL